MEIAGKRALVTGASSGIGRCVAVELARRGATVAVAARRAGLLEQLADEIEGAGGSRPAVLVADLAQRGAAAELAASAVDALGAVDLVVNKAGGAICAYQAAAANGDEARSVFELNVWSPVALVAALVPAMRERRTGAVVNVTSLMQVMNWPALGCYTASKAALSALSETLRLELRGSGVHVLEVIPGPVATPMQAEAMLVPGLARASRGVRVGSPEALARAVVRALRRERGRVVYPRSLRPTYAVPGVVRRFTALQAARLSGELDPDDPRVIRSGSQGDELARGAREAWERGERDPARLQALTSSPD